MKKLLDYGFNTENPFYIIAEIGINHGGDEDLAKRIIDSAVKAGADSVKFQTYVTEKRVKKESPIYDILKKCELPFEAFERLSKHAWEQDIDFFSTPFDEDSVECLEEIGVKLYKVASFDVTNQKLLERIAATEKTIIMSVGMANMAEITEAYSILKKKAENIAIMHCISAYPTNEGDANLGVIKSLTDTYDCVIGQSDHTNDIQVPLYAAAMGAQVLEKHYRIDGDMDCVDAVVSITEKQLSTLVDEVKRLTRIIGNSEVCMNSAEKDILQFRRETKIGE